MIQVFYPLTSINVINNNLFLTKNQTIDIEENMSWGEHIFLHFILTLDKNFSFLENKCISGTIS